MTLVPHGALRASALAFSNRAATAAEVDRMSGVEWIRLSGFAQEANVPHDGRSLADIATACRQDPLDCLVQVVREEDARADLCVFAPDTLQDHATYADPRRHPTGIDMVLVNGRVAARGGEVEALAGTALSAG